MDAIMISALLIIVLTIGLAIYLSKPQKLTTIPMICAALIWVFCLVFRLEFLSYAGGKIYVFTVDACLFMYALLFIYKVKVTK